MVGVIKNMERIALPVEEQADHKFVPETSD